MTKSTVKKIIGFIKSLKAPLQLLPYIMALVISVISRFTEDDGAQLVSVEEQGFVCHKSDKLMGGCGSPSITKKKGGVASVYACSRVVNNVLVHSLCLIEADGALNFSSGRRTFLFTSPMQFGSVTVTDTINGLMVSWHASRSGFRAPSCFTESAALSLKRNTIAAINDLPQEERNEGTYYAFVTGEGKPFEKVFKAPDGITQGAVALSDKELLWLGISDDKAIAYYSADGGLSFTAISEIPKIKDGRAMREVCCARLKNGRLVAVINGADELFISYSDDMGGRWSVPMAMDIKGTAPNLCVREDGVMALTYVLREKKMAIRSRISTDGQYEWGSERVVVASTGDLCRRPYTTEVNGCFCTVSRQRFCGEKESSVVYTLWKPHKDDFEEKKGSKKK